MIFDLRKIYEINSNKQKKNVSFIWMNFEGMFSPIFMENPCYA